MVLLYSVIHTIKRNHSMHLSVPATLMMFLTYFQWLQFSVRYVNSVPLRSWYNFQVNTICFTSLCRQGAFWGLMIGLVVGLIRMGLDFGYGSPGCGEEDTRPVIISKIHFLHFTIILFFVSLFSTIIISLATTPIDSVHVSS